MVDPNDTRQGGQGVLFVAHLCSDRVGDGMAGTRVGLKQLAGLTPERWAKFRQRSPRLAALDHPGLARHLETFRGPAPCATPPREDECDLYYSAHVWVVGDTVAEIGGKVRPDATFAWIRKLATTLDFLHGLPDGPIAHRDLHPGNVVITPAGNAVIIDYETALPFEGSATSTTMLMGRVGFIPPERVTDRTAPADAGDRWQLGMLTAYLLLGHPQGAMTARQLTEHLKDRLEGCVSDPRATADAVLSMLSERPFDRPESCAAWAESLVQPTGEREKDIRRPRILHGDGTPQPPSQAGAGNFAAEGRHARGFSLRALLATLPVLILALWWAANRFEAEPTSLDPRTAIENSEEAAGLSLIQLPSSGAEPSLITTAADGTLWFTEQHDDSIWRLEPGGAPVRVLDLAPGSRPFGITTAPDGSIWFTEGEADGSSGDAVGKLNPDGTLVHRTTFPKGSEPTGIVVAPDGRVWITAYGGKAVYWISPDGQHRGGPFATNGNPNRIIVGPDNNIWVTIATSPKVVVLSNDGVPVREYLVLPGPTDIVVAPDGKVWITSFNSNSVQWINSATGQVSEAIEVPGGPGALVVGPDGNLWLTQLAGRAVSVLSPAGDVVRTIPIAGGTPFGIAPGPDNAVWFTVQGVTGASPDAIGRISVRR